MATSISLSKIVKQKGISLTEATRRIADLGWTPSYFDEVLKYPTDYTIKRAPKDPMKQVLRSYFPMQEEKDNRVYGPSTRRCAGTCSAMLSRAGSSG